ncbi:hypothetical protein Tco_1091406 [Tanacetum coccineum]|uniref:Uncharacterized protein n=1 Tax=Tanacetum coccineum TaxID=301880 RepID=A0ABQ5I929_9ASTR
MGNAIVKLVKKVKSLEGKEYKRRKESTGKKVVSSLDFQEDNTGAEKINTAGEQDSTAGENKGQREGKAPMLSEETPKKTKEQILQEEASLAEAIRLDSLQREEEAKQIHLDDPLAQRSTEEEELTEQLRKEEAQVQFEASNIITMRLGQIRANLESHAEVIKEAHAGSEPQGEDFARILHETHSLDYYKDIKKEKKGVYQIVKVDGTDIGVNTPGSDENRLKLYVLMYNIVKVADTRVKD